MIMQQQKLAWLLLACTCLLAQADEGTDDELAKLSSVNIITEKPIIIQTVEKNYEQPTLREYEECHERREQCVRKCESDTTDIEADKCTAECPLCPILINQDILVQGVNDTAYQPNVHTTVNTTNVIRLTNEIRNLIDTNLGNITSRNENNIYVQQNISLSGGKYGMGYNEHGDCCLVVRSSRKCLAQQFSTAERCHHKRHRVCGERCKARVMYAKRVLKCNESKDNCEETIEYDTEPPKHRNSARHAGGCRYSNSWPFVQCGGQQGRAQLCRRCLSMPYGLVMSRGMPAQCMQCMQFIPGPSMFAGYYPMFNGYGHGNGGGGGFNNGDEFDLGASNDDELLGPGQWKLSKKKCRTAEGEVVECSSNDDGSGNFEQEIVDANQEEYYGGINDDYDEYGNDAYGGFSRYRRSGYSKRNKKARRKEQ